MSWYPHSVTAAAATEPVTLEEVKAQCRVDGDGDDLYLTGLIAAARSYVEDYTGTALIARTVALKCDGFADFQMFPVVPLVNVSEIGFVDEATVDQTLSAEVYEIRADGLTASIALRVGQVWPSIQTNSRITVTAEVGAAQAPASVKHALLLLIAYWYAAREGATDKSLSEAPHAITALLANYRSFAF